MLNLVQVQNNQVVVSSRQIAENFEKRHDHVLRDIEDILGSVPKIGETPKDLFYPTTYTHEQNKQEYPMYLMNRDGFALLAMGFTGSKALQWKIEYIKAFNQMEQQLKTPLIDDFERRKEIAEMIKTADNDTRPYIIQLFKGYFNNPSIENKSEKKQYSHVGEQDVVALFKKIIREEMENQDNSVRGLARKAEVSPALVSSYLSGKRSPGIVGADQVLKALGLTLVLGKES